MAANLKKAHLKKQSAARPGSARPATGKDPVRTMRFSDEFIAAVDAWAAEQEDEPGRAEAMRRLIEIGLRAGASAEDVRAQNKASDYSAMASELTEELGIKAKK